MTVAYWGVLLSAAAQCLEFADVDSQHGQYDGEGTGPYYYGPFSVDFDLLDVTEFDVFIAFVTLGVSSAPSGWTRLSNVGATNGARTVYALIADGTESLVTFTAGDGTSGFGYSASPYFHALLHYSQGWEGVTLALLSDEAANLSSFDVAYHPTNPLTYVGFVWAGANDAVPSVAISDVTVRALMTEGPNAEPLHDYSKFAAWDIVRLDADTTVDLTVTGTDAASSTTWLRYDCPAESAVQNLVADAVIEGEIELTWDALPVVTYILQRKRGSGSWTTIAGLGVGSNSYTDASGLIPTLVYDYRIRATRFGLESLNSAVASETALGDGPALINDDFADALAFADLGGGSFGQSFPSDGTTIIGATKETGEPGHDGNAGGHSVWFSFVPATSTIWYIEVDTVGGSSDVPLLAAYTGSSVNALTPVPIDTDFGSGPFNGDNFRAFTLDLTASTTYYIAVDGIDGIDFVFNVYTFVF